MKVIFIFLFLGSLGPTRQPFKPQKDSTPEIGYQLEDHQIVKRMAEPIEIVNHSENLLYKNSYLKQNQLVLPKEDLEYIRSNQITVNLSFKFQFEWWNAMQHHVLPEPIPRIVQSLKGIDVINRPRQIVSRLIWPSNYIRQERPFAHAILFYYDNDFNLMMAHQLETDLADWEIKAVAKEAKGAPQNYRFRLEGLTLNYPVPSLFENLQTKFIEVPTLHSRRDWKQWWDEFNQIFLNSWFFTEDNFDNYLIRPLRDKVDKANWDVPSNGEQKQRTLILEYQPYPYLKIYQHFFPTPNLKIRYHQYLDLNLEFNNMTLVVKKDQNYWEAFKFNHPEWKWWLNNHVEARIEDSRLILKPKTANLVQGEAKIKLIFQENSLSNLPLKTTFDFLQFSSSQVRESIIFDHFQNNNPDFFSQELFSNYLVSRVSQDNQFVLKALSKASFSGAINLTFREIKEVNEHSGSHLLPKIKKPRTWIIASWICFAIIILCAIVLVFLKFTKSKPTKK